MINQIKENSGYQDKNGEQIYFGEDVLVNNLKTPQVYKLGRFGNELCWLTDWGGLPVYIDDFKTCEIVK